MQTCVADYLLNAASTRPLALAVVDAHGELGHGALLHHALAVTRQVQSRDGQRQRPLAVLIGKSCAAVTAIAGATLAGHPYVPLDTASPVARLQAVLRQLGEPLVICTPQTQTLLNQLDVPAEHCLLLDPATLLNVPSAAEVADSLEQARHSVSAIIDTDPVYVMFTSGSTGVPKGVTIAHRSVVDYIEWARETYPVDATDRMASQAPLHFDNSTLDLYLCLATGATLYLPPDPTYAFPALTLDYLERHAITTVFWVPSVLVAIANSGLLQKRPPRHLRHILFAGEQMPVPHLNAWVDAVPGALFSNLYGPTEITVDCTAFTFRTRFEGDILPIGHARRNTEILVLAEDDTACAPGQIGELCVRGTALALGYWNDAARTAEVFVQNPLQTRYRDLIYRTGDLVRRDRDGCITCLGRKDSQIKHNGHRIELGEIEAATYALDGVAAACAVYDAARRRLTLAVAFKPGHTSDVVPLRLGLARRLPKYMMPNSIELMPHFPLNANGKIDRIELSTLIASRA